MTPDQKGSIAEAEIATAAIRLGIGVLKPLSDGLRYDLIFDAHRRLIRVQCKWAVRRGDVVVVHCRSSRRTRDGYMRRSYSADEVDAIAAYCMELDRCYFFPIVRFADCTAIQVRLAPARNNQKLGINWAAEYEFAATLGRLVGP